MDKTVQKSLKNAWFCHFKALKKDGNGHLASIFLLLGAKNGFLRKFPISLTKGKLRVIEAEYPFYDHGRKKQAGMGHVYWKKNCAGNWQTVQPHSPSCWGMEQPGKACLRSTSLCLCHVLAWACRVLAWACRVLPWSVSCVTLEHVVCYLGAYRVLTWACLWPISLVYDAHLPCLRCLFPLFTILFCVFWLPDSRIFEPTFLYRVHVLYAWLMGVGLSIVLSAW